jgi:hypothetical protein
VGGVDRRALTGHTSLASRTKTPVSTQTRLVVLYTSLVFFILLMRKAHRPHIQDLTMQPATASRLL